MNEKDAKTKWCPHMKGQFPVETKCIASDCAMWVWDATPAQVAVIKAQRYVEHSPYIGQPEACGHCGLIK